MEKAKQQIRFVLNQNLSSSSRKNLIFLLEELKKKCYGSNIEDEEILSYLELLEDMRGQDV